MLRLRLLVANEFAGDKSVKIKSFAEHGVLERSFKMKEMLKTLLG